MSFAEQHGAGEGCSPIGPRAGVSADDVSGVPFACGQNLGFFFDSDKELRGVIRQFFRSAILRGGKILYLTAHPDTAGVRERILGEGLIAEGLAKEKQFQVLCLNQTLLTDRGAPPQSFDRFFLSQVALAREEGFGNLWLTGEVPPLIQFCPDRENRVACQRRIHALVQETDSVMLSQYDLRTPDSGLLLDLLFTHPQVIYGDQLYDNTFLLPPRADRVRDQSKLITCLQNLSDRKSAEGQIRARVSQQAMVAELSRDALAGMELKALISKALRAAVACLASEASQVLEMDGSERVLVMRGGCGWGEAAPVASFPCSTAHLEGYALMEANQPVVVEDFSRENRFAPSPLVAEQRMVSAACVAIPGKLRPFGVLGVYRRQRRFFEREDLLFLQSLANILAVAIERQEADREIKQLAYYDTLTGLPNRTLLADRLDQAISRARREGHEVGVMFLDLDRFKSVNDTLGHASGDELLRVTARRLRESVRQSDTVARLGGDEFVVVLPELNHEEGVAGVAQKMLRDLAHPVMFGEHEVIATASIGIAVYPHDGADAGTLLRHADIAMYQSKERGKNTYQFFSQEMNARVQERLMLETSLRRALERDEFFVLYQPQLDLRSGRMIGMEALLRWKHPEFGVMTPDKFIPVAEETGLILNIGAWVLETACRQTDLWKEQGFSSLRLAVNISGRQFNHPCFIDMLDHVLEKTGFDPAGLELELTESTIMENADMTIMTLTDIKVRGVNLAIDDFGTGYSSLSYLKHFPFDRLKIAQSFVRDVTADPDNAAIVDAVIAVAHSLNIKVIAEGVETRQQLDFLYARQCDELQGYYFGRPIDVEKFTDLLRAGFSLKDICPYDAPVSSN